MNHPKSVTIRKKTYFRLKFFEKTLEPKNLLISF